MRYQKAKVAQKYHILRTTFCNIKQGIRLQHDSSTEFHSIISERVCRPVTTTAAMGYFKKIRANHRSVFFVGSLLISANYFQYAFYSKYLTIQRGG